jgi:transcriptional regulator with XRE-family HTH domain
MDRAVLILAARIRELRRAAYRHQVDVAALLGVSLSHYQRLERGKVSYVQPGQLVVLARTFDVIVDFLLELRDIPRAKE